MKLYVLAVFIVLSGCSNKSDDLQLTGFNLSAYTMLEEDENSTFKITFEAIGDEKIDVVKYELLEGTASFGEDLTEASGEATFTENKGTIDIPLIGDKHFELTEAFTIRLTYKDMEFNYGLTINDNDVPGEILLDDEGYYTPQSYSSMKQIWSEEFEGTQLDETNWTYEIGDGCGNGICGWGNNELESYTNNEKNIKVENGNLIITAIKETNGFSSARIITQDKVEERYGRIDIRARLPKGQGIWPAIWMLGANIGELGWPNCGEIDIMELVGHEPDLTHGTVHYDDGTGYKYSSSGKRLKNEDFSEKFHVFTLAWDVDKITWYLDNEPFKYFTRTPNKTYPFNNDFFFILNVAVGGNWPGKPDETTVFPQQMVVDYIRVFR